MRRGAGGSVVRVRIRRPPVLGAVQWAASHPRTMDHEGGTRAGLSATTKINRKDFGIDTKLPLDGGGVVIGDTVQISLDIQVVLVS